MKHEQTQQQEVWDSRHLQIRKALNRFGPSIDPHAILSSETRAHHAAISMRIFSCAWQPWVYY